MNPANPTEADLWKSAVLDQVFEALATAAPLREVLIYKGARVLSLRLGGGRQSFDIDSNLSSGFVRMHPERADQERLLSREVEAALRKHFERQNPVRYEMTGLRVRWKPRKDHPLGWNAFRVEIVVSDMSLRVTNLPAIEIDIAAPESLLPDSVSDLRINNQIVAAYTLERIAGEKLRAFLSSLPTYCTKIARPGRAVRAKDLYDLARIHSVHSLADHEFWRRVGNEFRLACQSRYIDCIGPETFQENWEVTRQTYSLSSTIPKDIHFESVDRLLTEIVGRLTADGVMPFVHPLPDE